ncbi:hypothetical protein ZIOFF_029321 [Zingiber officinale]|uniref:NEDD8 ultimate buster 1 n=1 Tax=Zingiber officinale TaxID=94328 RepID=A0A8J5H159_ZINOF|nr:hypothetical protein ZIOFF_029321 [Zingiber officinale]
MTNPSNSMEEAKKTCSSASIGSSATDSAAKAKVRIAGAWSGAVEVELEAWTLPMLREEVARRAAVAPALVKLIFGGKILRDDDPGKSLAQLGFKNNARVLSIKQDDQGKAIDDQAAAEDERAKKLARIKDAAKALTERHADGSLPMENYSLELENQSGQKMVLESESDRKYSFEALSLCDPKFTEIVDNVPMLQLDVVWCYFMLQDISCLAVAGVRLNMARKGFERCHGKDSDRLKLHTGYRAEHAIYLRLELLEGVVAFHSNNFREARRALCSAQARYAQLQVPDEGLSILIGMGYKENKAKRALRMTGNDIQMAVQFLVEEQDKKILREQENLQREAEIRQQQKYGATPMNKPIDLQLLDYLVSLSFQRDLAAEALRVNENDTQKALDLLTDPERNFLLQSQLENRKKRRRARRTEADVKELVSMGYDRSSAVAAVARSQTMDEALNILVGESSGNNNLPICDQPMDAGDGPSNAPSNEDQMDEGIEEDEEVRHTHPRDKAMRDKAMEDELANDLTGDALADYDIEVTKEGEAIAEYLARLDSIANE